MVRINIISPEKLMDQHLIAEYNEIMMLFGHVSKHPTIKNQPEGYCLGPGHITFFKDKLKYLKGRHELIKKEMKRRGFKPTKTINLNNYPTHLRNDWAPRKSDFGIIKKRLAKKIAMKPKFYRYEGKRDLDF